MRARASSGDMPVSRSPRPTITIQAGNQMPPRGACGFPADDMSPSLPDQLRAAVRFLGRVLGDVIRAQDGEAVFNQIEEIRQASVGFHREGTAEAARLVAERLSGLTLSDTVRFVHSFACFLQITNIAEDQIQRRRGRGGDARPDTLAGALRTLKADGVPADAVREL